MVYCYVNRALIQKEKTYFLSKNLLVNFLSSISAEFQKYKDSQQSSFPSWVPAHQDKYHLINLKFLILKLYRPTVTLKVFDNMWIFRRSRFFCKMPAPFIIMQKWVSMKGAGSDPIGIPINWQKYKLPKVKWQLPANNQSLLLKMIYWR